MEEDVAVILGRHERLVRRGDYLRGSFVKPERVDGYIMGINPGDRSDVLGRFGFAESSVERGVAAARRGYATWRRCSLAERSTVLRRYREALSKDQERFAAMVSRETGKPLWEARQEVVASIRVVDLLLDEGLPLLAPRVLHETDARSDALPHGVVGILVPHNLPLLHGTLQSLAAMMAGNTVVLKPSKFAPGVGQGIAEIMDRCRLPRGVFNLIQGSGAGIGQRLATHPSLDALVFSGTHASAAAIHASLADRPELPTLFHTGGKGTAIVTEGCDLDQAVYEVIVGAYLTAGQRYNSTGRVIVTKRLFDPFCEAMMNRTAGLHVGYAFDENVFMGPVISENVRSRYRRYGRNLEAAGHTALLTAENLDSTPRRGFYAAPSMYWVNGRKGQRFLHDEPPGPLLLAYRVEDWEEAVQLHNQLSFRPATALFCDTEHADLKEMVRRISTGSLNINRGTIGSSQRLPAAGLGRSSNGLSGGVDLLRFLTRPRAMLVERRAFDANHVVPGVNWSTDGSEPPDITGSLELEALDDDTAGESVGLLELDDVVEISDVEPVDDPVEEFDEVVVDPNSVEPKDSDDATEPS
ncbi:MAG: aldehyde dehydrogenase [Myxococcota bacterium]